MKGKTYKHDAGYDVNDARSFGPERVKISGDAYAECGHHGDEFAGHGRMMREGPRNDIADARSNELPRPEPVLGIEQDEEGNNCSEKKQEIPPSGDGVGARRCDT